jgi:hypothetical protein
MLHQSAYLVDVHAPFSLNRQFGTVVEGLLKPKDVETD